MFQFQYAPHNGKVTQSGPKHEDGVTPVKVGDVVDVFLPPGSLYVMTGRSRYDWMHGMALDCLDHGAVMAKELGLPDEGAAPPRRVSLTYRVTRPLTPSAGSGNVGGGTGGGGYGGW